MSRSRLADLIVPPVMVPVFLLLVALGLCTFAQGAFAAEQNCRAIESTGARLSCYDAAFPPKAKTPPIVDNSVPRSEYKDPLIAEEARLSTKLKNICRGC